MAGMADIITPYSGAAVFFGDNVSKWLNAYDAQRVAAYTLYENIYWNSPETFKLVMRGTNDAPVYLPSGRIIVNTLNRYVMRGFDWSSDPLLGEANQQLEQKAAYDLLFRREKFKSQFNTNKLYGLIRGDACWYLSADPLKPEGSRISIADCDPASVFEITDELDDSKVLGVEIIEQLVSAKDSSKMYIKRQSWFKSQSPEHPQYNEAAPVYDGEIAYEMRSLEIDGWDTDKPKTFAGGDQVPLDLVPGITHLPVYRWKAGTPESGNPWGNSMMRGIETIISAVNQAASDQDLALALAGLGQYVTDAGAPVDPVSNVVTTWGIGPAEVLEIPVGRKFERISGVSSVQPSTDHINLLQDQAARVHGASDVAQGRVDVTVAESGIALQLRMGPLLDEADQQDTEIVDCLTQMFHDLKEWFIAYEGSNFGDCEIIPTKGDKLPENKEQRFQDLMAGLAMQPPLFSQEYVWSELTRMGWVGIKPGGGMQADIAAEIEFYSSASDAYGTRLDDEAGAEDDSDVIDDVEI